MNVKNYIVYPLESVFYNGFIRFLLRKKPKYNKKYRISICGIFKNEARFLKEWIEYHLMIGVDHFYMYNNNSEDNYLEVLQPYINKGYVTLVQWTKDHAQMEAYQHFYANYAKETQWLSFLDIDEFIIPRYATNINDWIKEYEKYPVILIYWKMFGTGGKLKHDYNRLTIEQYTVCHEGFSSLKGKCIVNTDYEVAYWNEMSHHHTCVKYPFMGFNIRCYGINPFHRFVIGPRHPGIKNSAKATIQINHYWSKAWDVYDEKRQRTDVFFVDNPKKSLDYFYRFEEQNISCDYSIFRFVIKLKHRLLNIQ